MSYQNVNSTFSRVANNIEKMGAYYTDRLHCCQLGKLFKWPDAEVSVLEPSIGDGAAVMAITNADKNPNIKLFGVELNDEVAERTKQHPLMEALLKADFLNGVRIKNNAFSFVFGNPPYMDDGLESKERMELQFLRKVSNYLTKGGIIVWVIPHRVFVEDSFIRFWHTRYETLGVYKFHAEEYAKYGQVALIGRKASGMRVFLKDEFESYKREYLSIDSIEEVPVNYDGELIEVLPSSSEEVTLFGTIAFDATEASNILIEKGNDLDKLFETYASVPEYLSTDIGQPPIPPKNDSLYLLSVCGVGSGYAGTKGEDLHLQRGVAEIVEEKETVVEESGKNKKVLDKFTTKTAIKMTIIQTNGTITHLM